MIGALESYGYQAEHLRSIPPDQILMFALGERHYQGHIELTNRIARYTYEKASARMQTMDIQGLKVPFIGYRDLILNKQAAARPRDLDDVTHLQKIHGTAKKISPGSADAMDYKAAYEKKLKETPQPQSLWQKVKDKISLSKRNR